MNRTDPTGMADCGSNPSLCKVQNKDVQKITINTKTNQVTATLSNGKTVSSSFGHSQTMTMAAGALASRVLGSGGSLKLTMGPNADGQSTKSKNAGFNIGDHQSKSTTMGSGLSSKQLAAMKKLQSQNPLDPHYKDRAPGNGHYYTLYDRFKPGWLKEFAKSFPVESKLFAGYFKSFQAGDNNMAYAFQHFGGFARMHADNLLQQGLNKFILRGTADSAVNGAVGAALRGPADVLHGGAEALKVIKEAHNLAVRAKLVTHMDKYGPNIITESYWERLSTPQ